MQTPINIRNAAVVLSAIVVVGAATAVLAHKGATGVVMERMNAMKSMGDNMKALSLMVTGKAAFSADKTKKIASTLKTHASDIAKLFPKGSIKGPSEALPKIWTDWDEFIGYAKSLEGLAGQLEASAANSKTASRALFAKMGKTCSGCHQDFRQKKDKK